MSEVRYTEAHIQRSIAALQKRSEELRDLDVSSLTGSNDPRISALSAQIRITLLQVFGEGTSYFNIYESAAKIRPASRVAITGVEDHDFYHKIQNLRLKAMSLIAAAINTLEEKRGWGEEAPVNTKETCSNKVFIVHGHDDGAKHEAARFLSHAGFEPIILHEQANQGDTVIEKLQRNSDCGYAVVLITPDDVGGKSANELRPRARQNVILELGYFIGKLGRERVSALKKGDIETPSDFDGVVYTTMDTDGGWKQALARELKAAGYFIDWNMVMG